MKSKVGVLVVAMAIIALAATAGLAGKALFEDKFANLDPSWGFPGEV